MRRGIPTPPTPRPPEPLRSYAFLGDGERGALIGPHGEIVWMCAPHWHSDAVFSALIGGPGSYTVSPTDDWYTAGGHYEEGALIWRSRWITSDGVVESREALALPGEAERAVILRRLDAVDRPVRIVADLHPRAGFGRNKLHHLRQQNGVWVGRTGDLRVRWSGAEEAREHEGGLRLDCRIERGETRDLVLELATGDLPERPPDADDAWGATEKEWQRRIPPLEGAVGRRDARLSCAVLHGMTASTGAMVAAATTSLPEQSRPGRDYDYRYAWLRDQSLAVQAAEAAGATSLLDAGCEFISQRLLADGDRVHPAYTVTGERLPDQAAIRDLPGYPGARALVGNHVGQQFQLDVLGEALLALAAAARQDRFDVHHWKATEIAVRAIEARGQEPDAGIWELENRAWTHSRLACAGGLRAMADCAPRRQAAEWVSLADQIVARTARDSLHPTGRWQRAPDDERVDAALLFPTLRGAVPPGDPRHLATLAAVQRELVDDDFVYRFRHDARPLDEAEGAFLLCGFMAAMVRHQGGEQVAARALYERNRAACGPAGLFAEEYDVPQRQLRGNLPQAFVHAAMLEASVRLAEPWRTP